MTNDLIQWMGFFTGATGALLLAINKPYSGYGFVAFLLSNGFWLSYGLRTDAHGLVAMQIVFTMTSLVGIKRWLFPDNTAPQGS